MTKIDFALWDAVGGYSSRNANMADVYDEHIRLAQQLEGLVVLDLDPDVLKDSNGCVVKPRAGLLVT